MPDNSHDSAILAACRPGASGVGPRVAVRERPVSSRLRLGWTWICMSRVLYSVTSLKLWRRLSGQALDPGMRLRSLDQSANRALARTSAFLGFDSQRRVARALHRQESCNRVSSLVLPRSW
jgi:hypothetical protein